MSQQKEEGGALRVLSWCDTCRFVLPKGCGTRHPHCCTFLEVRKAETRRFDEATNPLGVARRARYRLKYASTPGANAVVDLLEELSKERRLVTNAPAVNEVNILLYRFLAITDNHPRYRVG